MSGSFDAEDLPERARPGAVERSPGMSSDRTPVTSQKTLLGRIITTPPTLNAGTFLPDPDDLQSPSQSPQRTPSEVGNAYDALEPPAWEAPGSDEVAYTDAWNVQHSYSDRQHFLRGPGGSALARRPPGERAPRAAAPKAALLHAGPPPPPPPPRPYVS